MDTITHNELTQKMVNNDDFILVNVLPPEYFDQAHIPGSANVPYEASDFIEKIESIAGSKDKEVIVYCANHMCTASDDAAKRLAESGFSKVTDFAGGTQEWMESGKPLQSKSAGGCGTSCGCG